MSLAPINPYAAPQSVLTRADHPIPSQEVHPERYQTIFKRIIASIIDIFIIIIPITILEFSIFDWHYGSPNSVMVNFITSLIFLFYNVVLHALFGKTLGKHIMHLRLVDISETRNPSLFEAIKKETSYILIDITMKGYITFLVWHEKLPSRHAKELISYKIFLWISATWLVIELFTILLTKKKREPNDFIAITVLISEA